MKKLMFTAIALVAFSGVSMANMKGIKPSNTKKVAKKVVIRAKTDCCLIYDLAYQLNFSETCDIEWSEMCANYAYNNCEKSNQ